VALFLVATPIGNLKDVTERAKETLARVSAVVAEDTRRTGQLLRHRPLRNRWYGMMSMCTGGKRQNCWIGWRRGKIWPW
jgi:16S rRNA C1402 (ribose-2'-O) methylase RsmI